VGDGIELVDRFAADPPGGAVLGREVERVFEVAQAVEQSVVGAVRYHGVGLDVVPAVVIPDRLA